MKKVRFMRSEKGSASVLVLVTVLVFITVLTSIFMIVSSKEEGQLKSDLKIQNIYGADINNADFIYNQLSGMNKNVTITMENSSDYLFTIKSVVTIDDGTDIDFSKCKYVYTSSNALLGNDITSYTEGSITSSTTTIEKAKAPGTYYLHVLITDRNGRTAEKVSSTAVTIASVQNYDYTGAIQQAKLMPGDYQFECWGARGGTVNQNNANYGGYTSGNINLSTAKDFYIFVGGMGGNNATVTNVGGYNGGGYSGNNSGANSTGGGGATDIRVTRGNGNWNDFDGLKSRIMVAAGGAGTANTSSYTLVIGYGGGLTGGTGTGSYNSEDSTGATQTGTGTGHGTAYVGAFGYALQSNSSGWGGGRRWRILWWSKWIWKTRFRRFIFYLRSQWM